MSDFGKLVDSARSGQLSRRGFLAAALAFGIGGDDAEAELVPPTRIVVPDSIRRGFRITTIRERIHQPFRDSFLRVRLA